MKNLKHFIIAICIFFTTVTPSFALLPILAIPSWYLGVSVAMHASVAAVGLYYAMKPNQSASVDDLGTASRPVNVTWVDTKDLDLKELNVNAKISKSKVADIARSKPDKYPLLKEAVTMKAPPAGMVPTASTKALNVGTVITLSGGNYTISGVPQLLNYGGVTLYGGNPQVTKTPLVNSTVHTLPYISYVYQDPNGMYGNEIRYQKVDPYNGPLSERDATPAEYKNTVAPSGTVNPSYRDELDKMLQDPSYVPVFTDEGGLPHFPPPDVMTPAQLVAENKKREIANQQEKLAGSTGAALDASQKSTDTAGNAYVASGGNLATGTGGDAGLYQKYLDSKSLTDQLKASNDSNDLQQLKEDAAKDELLPTPEAGEVTQFNFSGLERLKGAMNGAYPFNYISRLSSYYSALETADHAAPVLDLPIYQDIKVHVDLSIFDPVAAVIRFVLGSLMSAGAIMMIVKFYRGVS